MGVHRLADVHESVEIRPNTRVWQYVVIMENAEIGDNCNICAHALIEGGVKVGDGCTIKSGVFLWDGVILGDRVFVGPNATFTNDLRPRSKEYPDSYVETVVESGASIGANATILAGVRIGRNAMIGAGSVVVKDVPENAVVVGNPARIIRYLDEANVE